jgi:hypothetical protein
MRPEHAATPTGLVMPDAFHPQYAEEVQSGKGEQHDPGSEETLPRENVRLQNLVDGAELVNGECEDDESKHDLDARQPTTATRQLLL